MLMILQSIIIGCNEGEAEAVLESKITVISPTGKLTRGYFKRQKSRETGDKSYT